MSNINQRQVQTLQQKLSPQQIQMIKLLELPTAQLDSRIKEEIESNIVLEEQEPEQNDDEQPARISVEEYLKEDDTPSYKAHINNRSKDDKQRPVYITGGRSLQESLIEQLGFRNLSQHEMTLARYLVGSLDEDGYLRRDMEAISDDLAFTVGVEASTDELERLLAVIQELEPAGIGARSLQECLLLQINQLPMTSRSRRTARKILTDHFDEFVKKHYEKLIGRMHITEDEFREAAAEIRRLSPRPGGSFSEGTGDAAPYIIPDFLLDYQNGKFDLQFNSYIKHTAKWLKIAADRAGELGIGLAMEMHHGTLLDCIDGAERLLEEVEKNNVGLIFDPVNLYQTGTYYGADAIRRIADRIFDVHVKDIILLQDDTESGCFAYSYYATHIGRFTKVVPPDAVSERYYAHRRIGLGGVLLWRYFIASASTSHSFFGLSKNASASSPLALFVTM